MAIVADRAGNGFLDTTSAQPLATLLLGNHPAFVANMEHMLGGRQMHYRHILGSRTAGWENTSSFGDACEYLDTTQSKMNTPLITQTLYVVSTNAADAAAGTGVRTVQIVYLAANGDERTTTATLNGATPVSIGTGFSAIQWMEAVTVGTGGVAAGAISVTSTNGAATVATTFERIAAGGNRSLSGRYKIPRGYTGYLLDWAAAAISNTMDTRLRRDALAYDDTVTPDVYHFIDRVFLASGTSGNYDGHFLRCLTGTTIKVSAIPGGAPAGNKLDANFMLLLIED